MKPVIPDILAARYASTAMATTWSPSHKIVLERELWLAVLRAQADLGVDVPAGAIEAYQQIEHVLRRAHRTLDPAQRVPRDQVVQATQRDEQLVRDRREPLAERGGLRRYVV